MYRTFVESVEEIPDKLSQMRTRETYLEKEERNQQSFPRADKKIHRKSFASQRNILSNKTLFKDTKYFSTFH